MKAFLIFLLLAVTLLLPGHQPLHAETLKLDSSTQFLWGDDILGEDQAVLAQYVRFSITPEDAKYSITGYGRIWDDLGSPAIRDDDFSARLYYLFLDYRLSKSADFRLGRQYVNFTAGSSIMDGLSVNVRDLGPVGLTLAGGLDVRYTLDSEDERSDNAVFAADVHLEKVKPLQLGLSYFRRHDEGDLAREGVGINARGFFNILSPYTELRYDIFSETIDEATVGLNIYPSMDLLIRLEYYHSYPTFDATSIFSVFAVDRYQEYLALAEYNLKAPVTLFASYARQTYDGADDDDADRFEVGARATPVENLAVSGSLIYRNGTGGDILGFELLGDYKLKKKYTLSAGVQYDTYERPDFDEDDDYATRLWLGGEWLVSENVTLQARIEENINENFDSRPMGRVLLNWTL